MTYPIYPCLWFDGKAKEAASLYCSVFKNSRITGDSPMVVNFELNGKKFMALNGGPMYKINPAISLFVNCESVDETNRIWNLLIEGGKALMAIDTYPWSQRYGWLEDKFGLSWQISVSTPEGTNSIRPSMLFTNEQLGRAKEAIDFYSSVFDNCTTDMMAPYPPDSPFAGKLMYSEFKINGYPLIAMDGPGPHHYGFNEAVSFVVNCDTQKEIDRYWNNLTEGGQEGVCGWLKDRFGVSWQIVPTVLGKLMSDPEKSPRVIEMFMKMKKFDIEKLLSA
jgi:predicted 3-demethylubiquinone-9 3-methyltransferase (glyoxalase superfamily)